MKAYKVYDPNNWEGYQDIVFATTASEAKKKGFGIDSCEDSEWVNVRVNRIPYLDNMENCTKEEIMYVAILNGWWYEVDGNRYDDDNIYEAIEKVVVSTYKVLEEKL